ncbi:glycine oxidase ThiO [Acinetobacter sp. MD2(2019)]|uniref:glycine oxidase ThiO n=1 Tax=Acinetobacter sp. MD2(2019) TaxID=2605273 RepID=UPI002D1F50AD|nr:glycine oxidase ThiO [Acinetobacter sp. MD2(2019)]MEB3754718.1 glycine oxidase ThiO [Acinetobacter sp. MD2(2019)]
MQHIAIIGAGISGLLTALELIEHGCTVSIFDQQEAGKEASWAGGGILSPMYPWRYPKAVNDLAQHGKTLYEAINQKISPFTQIDFEIHNSGMLIFDEADFDVGQDYAKAYQDPMQICQKLQQTELRQVNPKVSKHFSKALYFPHLANVRNPRLLQSLTHYLKQHNQVTFKEHCPIEQLNFVNGAVQSVTTRSGKTIVADQFILATGAWSQNWQQQLNLHIPVQPIHGQMALFKTPANWLPTMCMNRVMYLIPRADGHIVCGSSMNDFGFDKSVKSDIQNNIIDAAKEMVPELLQFPLVAQWAGLRPSSPTGVPYIGKMPEIANLWANFGHFRNGLCMGPASAKLLRQLILKQPTFIDPQAYSAQRLTQLHPQSQSV